MKLRALLLLALVIGGAYMMLESKNELKEQPFISLLDEMKVPFQTLTFSKPSPQHSGAEAWIVDEPHEIHLLLTFFENYHIRKIDASELNLRDETDQYVVKLEDINGRELKILLDEALIIQDSRLYYEIVDGPLDVDWLVTYFLENR